VRRGVDAALITNRRHTLKLAYERV
jgi:hypothetical protein